MATRVQGTGKVTKSAEAPAAPVPAAVEPKRVRVVRDKFPSSKPFIIMSESGMPLARYRTEEEVRKNLPRFK